MTKQEDYHYKRNEEVNMKELTEKVLSLISGGNHSEDEMMVDYCEMTVFPWECEEKENDIDFGLN